MATQQQKDDLINIILKLKKLCDSKIDGENGSVYAYISIKLTSFVMTMDSYDFSIFSDQVIIELMFWANQSINALKTPTEEDDLAVLNTTVGKLADQFPVIK
ncbi:MULTISPECIES: hypothetical protein [Pectobacterium]|uniref:Uncharacterized protein n=1 Tax=Pectobacterium parmentieri TaxID=1905730 RepID=A0A0H3I4W8_PECPM|nr:MULTISPECIES: hypothetical protein [Pectobacterium]AFI89743.1 Hypothetical protein W5S_1651 [Pectobacterium parmentieri]AOR59349.1 hypothetical protein A8F97_10575 [Pectobacterium parmentieri]ASN84960.1 Hypothetical protein SCC1_1521 [Pectobacterium versatile]MBN3195937.1 hypothetical protein [Pectobacterium versatile]MCA6961658.1 hypothetical protein [Pectobacterium odoriferum]